MSTTLRLRGDEVQVRLTQNGTLIATLTAIKSADFILGIEKKSEGFLGEGTQRKDMQFMGAKGTLQFQPESQDALTLAFAIKQRAARRVAQGSIVVSMSCVSNFANGDRPRISVNDMQFGDIPFNVGARENYVGMTLDWETDDMVLATV